MNYALLALIPLLLTLQKITQKRYNAVCRSGAFLFSGLISLCAMCFFLAVTTLRREWVWDPLLWIPAVGFGVSYAVGTAFVVLAIRNGSLAKTTLVTSYSLLIPAFAGLLILDEPAELHMLVGIFLLILSLWLTHHRKENGSRPTLVWGICVGLAFAGNGLCSTVQKLAPHYAAVAREGQTVYMTMAFGLASLILMSASFLTRERERGTTLHRGIPLAILCGLCNGCVNLLVLYLNSHIPASVMFPSVSAGQIILVCMYARLICREQYSKKQWAGFAVGILSVILLNL